MATNQRYKLDAILDDRRDTWRYYITYLDANNKRRQKWVNTGLPIRGNKRKAEAMKESILAEWEPKLLAYQKPTISQNNTDSSIKDAQIADESSKGYEKTLFADYMLTWLDSVKNGLQITTYSEYKRTIEKNICPFFRKKDCILKI